MFINIYFTLSFTVIMASGRLAGGHGTKTNKETVNMSSLDSDAVVLLANQQQGVQL